MAKKDFMNLMKEKTVDVRPSILSAEEDIKSRIVILDEFRDLIPPLTEDELTQLELNLVQHGVKDPLTIWETDAMTAGLNQTAEVVFVLVDGHNRYPIIRRHKLDFRINLVQFPTKDDVRDYMIKYQLGRRNLTPDQISYLRGLRYNQQKSVRGSNLTSDGPQMNVAQALADEYGVSSRTIKRDGEFAARLDVLEADVKRDVLTGKQKIPKSSIVNLGKPNSVPELINDSPSTTAPSSDEDTLNRITILQNRIHKTANGVLDYKSCETLIKQAIELLKLLSSKGQIVPSKKGTKKI